MTFVFLFLCYLHFVLTCILVLGKGKVFDFWTDLDLNLGSATYIALKYLLYMFKLSFFNGMMLIVTYRDLWRLN